MTAREGRRLASMSPPSLVLAAGSSVAVAAAAVAGHGFGTPDVLGAFAVAGTIGVLSAHGRPQAQPYVLRAGPVSNGVVTISASRARSLAAHPSNQSADAA